ncbi:CU044_5270 family protein [Streptosporangium saharense]|uniref:CU044_5270 family protein n=1 Tax=Streptosporangium saharense TaxID=1706840 RepID=UPI003415C97A
MDDLDSIATLLAKPEPSREVLLRSRGRLEARMAGRGRRRTGWLVPVVALATAAAAVVAVITMGSATPTAPTVPSGDLSGRDVLLMAAVSAEHTPQGSGTYWHVLSSHETPDMPSMESWTSRDGRRWTRGMEMDPPEAVMPDPRPLMLKGAEVSFEDLETLPTDPEALRTWIVERKGNPDNMSRSEQRGEPLFPLISLITELPTPPEVRSAAFRALATTPGVRNTGAVEGGQELVIPDPDDEWETRLVVDPETAQVKRTNFLLGGDGSLMWSKGSISLTTEWTNQLPR